MLTDFGQIVRPGMFLGFLEIISIFLVRKYECMHLKSLNNTAS